MSLISTIGQFLRGVDDALTINIPWIGLIWGICLLIVANAIVQIAVNTFKQDVNELKTVLVALGVLFLEGIVAMVGYYFFYFSFANKLFKKVDYFINYAMNIIPFSFILFWLVLPALAMYLFFSARGLAYYYKKKHDYYSWKKESEQKQEVPVLDSIVEQVEIKKAPDFRKWLKQVTNSKTVAVKVNDYYFVPVYSGVQQSQADSITGATAAEGSVLVGKVKGSFEALTPNEAIIKVRSLLKKGGDH
ncbi:hypothetical protein LMB49_03855 [Limosilactobacillus reuteri]|uniref:hypothetical protein n=1 Tax=Limosilactobacillus reuteri TaxID=1598 RepID=UPI001E3C9943|nr:hypothetical protein [Limosilactobacillus reuteri]MCC4370532.1 hypothetical protein [Limosilactobacillus reuteri]MCC4509413.1 hypothetical protein [Limosilactobacillus reuteri]